MLIVGLSILNVFQTIQFHKGVIDADRMTKDYYLKVFGKLNVNEKDRKLLLVNRTFLVSEMMESEMDYSSKLLQKIDFENLSLKDSSQGYNSRHSFLINNLIKLSPAISATYDQITHKDHAWIKVTAYVFPTKDVMEYPFNLIVCFNHNEYPYKYMRYASSKMNISLNKWNKIEFYYLTPEVRSKKDYLKVYFENEKESNVFIDDLEVNVYERK